MKNLILILLLCSITACSSNAEQGNQSNNTTPTKVSTKHDSNKPQQGLANNAVAKKAKEKIIGYEEINEVIAVHDGMELIVGFNVKKLEEFNVKKIEERVNKDLQKEFPNEIITVSHDRKILLELEKLLNEEEGLKDKDIRKRLQHLKKLSKEKT
jgi:hypothetical protein